MERQLTLLKGKRLIRYLIVLFHKQAQEHLNQEHLKVSLCMELIWWVLFFFFFHPFPSCQTSFVTVFHRIVKVGKTTKSNHQQDAHGRGGITVPAGLQEEGRCLIE